MKELRIAEGLSQKQLAERSGLSQSYICHIEKGRTPSVKAAKKIADVFGIDWWLLFEKK